MEIKDLDGLKKEAPLLYQAAAAEGHAAGLAEGRKEAESAANAPATLAQLQAIGASDSAIVASLKAGHTLSAAQGEIIAGLRKELAEVQAANVDLQKKLDVAARGGGVPPLKLSVPGATDAAAGTEADYDAAVRAVQAANPKWTNSQCVAEVNRTRPDLREAKFGNARKKA